MNIWAKYAFRFQDSDYYYKYSIARPTVDQLKDKEIIIVSYEKFKKWAFLRCPCGCNETILISLMPNQLPNWKATIDKYNRITLSPSIRKNDGCRSHFFVKKGKIIWASDD
jgi:hypothetical protein